MLNGRRKFCHLKGHKHRLPSCHKMQGVYSYRNATFTYMAFLQFEDRLDSHIYQLNQTCPKKSFPIAADKTCIEVLLGKFR